MRALIAYLRSEWEWLFLPFLILMGTFLVASIGFWSTLLSLLLLPLTLTLATSFWGVKDTSPFYLSYTVNSVVIFYGAFEKITVHHYRHLTIWEYSLSLVLFGAMVALICWTRYQCSQGLTSPLASHGNGKRNYEYCRKCKGNYPGRDHHCVWLGVCIGRGNRKAFLLTLLISLVWLIYTALLNLTTICYPSYLFQGFFGWNRGDSSITGGVNRWFLFPTTCPDAYHVTRVTVLYILSLYGILAACVLLFVLLHQLRLLWMGKTLLEHKFGCKEENIINEEKEILIREEEASKPGRKVHDEIHKNR